MHILFITDKPYPPEPRIKNEAYVLMQKASSVSLISVHHKRVGPHLDNVQGMPVHRIILSPIYKKLQALCFTFPFYHLLIYRRLCREIEKFRFDVLYVHNIVLYPIIYLKYRKRAPIVLDIHENLAEIIKHYPHYDTFWGKLLIYPTLWKKMEAWCIRTSSLCVVVAPEAKEHYRSYIHRFDSYYVLPNMTNATFLTAKTSDVSVENMNSEEYTMIYVGDTGLRRGILTAIRAIPAIRRVVPNIQLIVLGSSRTDDVLHREIAKLDISEHVVLVGWVEETLFPSYISASKIGICPLHRNIHHDTTYANKLFQYLACEVPVLVSDCTAQKNFVEEHQVGLVHESENTKDFADKIIQMATNEQLYKQFKQNAASTSHEYTWESYADAFSSELAELSVQMH